MGDVSDKKVEVCEVDTCVRVTKDGDAICALLGDNLQAGQAGFGQTVSEALHNLAHELQRQPVPWGPSATPDTEAEGAGSVMDSSEKAQRAREIAGVLECIATFAAEDHVHSLSRHDEEILLALADGAKRWPEDALRLCNADTPEAEGAVEGWLTFCEERQGRIIPIGKREAAMLAAARSELAARGEGWEVANRCAKNWEDDARRYARNADYWRGRAEKAEAELAARDERVVEVGGSVSSTYLLLGRHILGLPEAGRYAAVDFRRLPDAPEPERVRSPYELRTGNLVCATCHQPVGYNPGFCVFRNCPNRLKPWGEPRPLDAAEKEADDE